MRVTVPVLTLLLMSACVGGRATPSPPSEGLTVVTTTTVLADFVRQVGGDRVEVHALVPKGGEVHTFDPAPSDAVALNGAELLVLNGLGLDDWVLPFAAQAGAGDVRILEVAEELGEVEYLASGDDGEHRYNPHLWLNLAYAAIYADRIRLKLIEADPAGQAEYDANMAVYEDRLSTLDGSVRSTLAAIPQANRRVISFHDAFPYFAAAYGLEIVGVLVEAPGQEPSAAEVAALIESIRASGARAILAEAQFSDELARTVAAETDAVVISDLYSDSLGDAPLDTYERIMSWNAERIVEALR